MAFGGIAGVLNQWQAGGVFDFLLPFLFVFAVVYGILTYAKIFGDNKPTHVILSVAVGLMALQWVGFTEFTKEIFPKLGIGLSVIFVAFVMVSLFIAEDERKYWSWGLGALAIIAFLVTAYTSFENLGLLGYSGFLGENIGYIVGGVMIIGLIIAVVASKEKEEAHKGYANFVPFFMPSQQPGKSK